MLKYNKYDGDKTDTLPQKCAVLIGTNEVSKAKNGYQRPLSVSQKLYRMK
jgi:hypothetical protein